MFLIAISEIDQSLYEDESVNRMTEAATRACAINIDEASLYMAAVFSSVVNSQWFSQSTIIVFLNKIDILRTKLRTVRVADFVADYTGDNSFDDVTNFFAK
jgi:guanine nucleotide-binding protein subunit alpha